MRTHDNEDCEHITYGNKRALFAGFPYLITHNCMCIVHSITGSLSSILNNLDTYNDIIKMSPTLMIIIIKGLNDHLLNHIQFLEIMGKTRKNEHTKKNELKIAKHTIENLKRIDEEAVNLSIKFTHIMYSTSSDNKWMRSNIIAKIEKLLDEVILFAKMYKTDIKNNIYIEIPLEKRYSVRVYMYKNITVELQNFNGKKDMCTLKFGESIILNMYKTSIKIFKKVTKSKFLNKNGYFYRKREDKKKKLIKHKVMKI